MTTANPAKLPYYSQAKGDASALAASGRPLFKANEGRRALLIQSKGPATLYVSFNGPASADDLELYPGGAFAEHRIPPGNEVWLYAAGPCRFYAYEG